MPEKKTPGLGTAVKLAPDRCINCRTRFDGASVVDEVYARPKPGDFTVCIRCGHIMAFGNNLRLRNLTDEEIIEVAGDARIVRATTAIKAINDDKI